MPITPHGFESSGGLISPKNPLDLRVISSNQLLASSSLPRVNIPDVSAIPIYYQGHIGSCTSMAVTWMTTYVNFLNDDKIKLLSARFVYALAKRDDGILPKTEQGSNVTVSIDKIIQYGICEDSFFPNDVNLSYEQYTDTTKISPEAYKDAYERKARNRVLITDLTFEGLKAAINNYHSVAVLVHIGKEWWTDVNGNISWSEKDLLPVRPPVNYTGGHEICIFGYNDDYIFFANSFSDQWGRRGIGYFGRDYMPHVFEAYALVDLPDSLIISIKQQEVDLLKKIVELLKQQIELK